MKDQYFGDVNDYRKYGLLRLLGGASGLALGICWLRTANDTRSDGEFRSYLQQPARFRGYDPELFDAMTGLLDPNLERSVLLADRWNLLPNATYHHRVLTDSAADRELYFAEAWSLLSASPLIFLDPDNGHEVQSVPHGRTRSSKYVYWRELEEAARRGHSIVLYQHFRREARDSFIERVSAQLLSRLHAAHVTAFHTAHVVFFLVARAEHATRLAAAAAMVEPQWRGQIRCSSLADST